MNQLATLDDLPLGYRESLTDNNLVPLWPNMRAVLPHGKPSCRTKISLWAYDKIRPLLMQAGELTPIEKAERRVLVLANKGHGLENMQATPSIYLGLQLILPNETAPNHRHTPNAVRIIVEGEGAYTSVNGEPCRMERGDLILTPSGMWHEHRHEGSEPIVWLDVLDLPLIYQLEGSWATEGQPQELLREDDKSFAEYNACGIVPSTGFARQSYDAPMLRYPWSKTRRCLEAMAERSTEPMVQVRYVNPETGKDLFPSIGFGAMMLKPNASISLPKRTTPCVFHTIAGSGEMKIDNEESIFWQEKDTFCTPGYRDITLINTSDEPAFLITADEAPLHHYLRIF